jgi:hypothetical protein
VRTRLIGLLAAGVMFLAVATAAAPNVSAAAGATCTLAGSKVVGSSGGRFYDYAVTVRMGNLTASQSRITTVLTGRFDKTYSIGATVAPRATVNKTKVFSAPRGTTFTVSTCTQT